MTTATCARYDLPVDEIRRVTVEHLERHPEPAGRYVALVLGPHEPLANVARAVERQVFEQTFGNDAAQMAEEYGPYEENSLFLLVLDRHRGAPAGAGRAIEGTGPGTKTVDDAPGLIGQTSEQIAAAHGLHGEKVWDFATLAVLPQYRGLRTSLTVSSLLYRAFLVQGEREGVQHMTAMLDRGAYRNMKLLGTPFEPLAGSGPFPYLGSPENRAVYARFPLVAGAIGEQAARLRRLARPGVSDIRHADPRKLIKRRIAAEVSRKVATGKGLDQHIVAAPARG